VGSGDGIAGAARLILRPGSTQGFTDMRLLPAYALAAALSAGLLAVGVASAQDQPGAPGGDQGRGCMAGVWASLGLSDAQKTQLQQIRASNLTGPDRRAAIEKILTPDQRAQLAAAREKCRAEHGK
jgi:Spy/CpxP family protein refolding chaperone